MKSNFRTKIHKILPSNAFSTIYSFTLKWPTNNSTKITSLESLLLKSHDGRTDGCYKLTI